MNIDFQIENSECIEKKHNFRLGNIYAYNYFDCSMYKNQLFLLSSLVHSRIYMSS